jgi:osmotically inducible lipoprotein OsmB
MRRTIIVSCALGMLLLVAGCAGGPLTTREKGGLFGGALGAGTGALIGSATGSAATGAAIGGPIGLVAGGVIGDQLQGREHAERRLQGQVNAQGRELRRQGAELERLKRKQRYEIE